MLLEGGHVLQLTKKNEDPVNQLAVVSRPPTKLNSDCNGTPPAAVRRARCLGDDRHDAVKQKQAGKRVTSGGGGHTMATNSTGLCISTASVHRWRRVYRGESSRKPQMPLAFGWCLALRMWVSGAPPTHPHARTWGGVSISITTYSQWKLLCKGASYSVAKPKHW